MKLICVYFFQRVNDAMKEEYLKRVYSAILSNTELESIVPGIGKFSLKCQLHLQLMTF